VGKESGSNPLFEFSDEVLLFFVGFHVILIESSMPYSKGLLAAVTELGLQR
jgi:hypothetical protein